MQWQMSLKSERAKPTGNQAKEAVEETLPVSFFFLLLKRRDVPAILAMTGSG